MSSQRTLTCFFNCADLPVTLNSFWAAQVDDENGCRGSVLGRRASLQNSQSHNWTKIQQVVLCTKMTYWLTLKHRTSTFCLWIVLWAQIKTTKTQDQLFFFHNWMWFDPTVVFTLIKQTRPLGQACIDMVWAPFVKNIIFFLLRDQYSASSIKLRLFEAEP